MPDVLDVHLMTQFSTTAEVSGLARVIFRTRAGSEEWKGEGNR